MIILRLITVALLAVSPKSASQKGGGLRVDDMRCEYRISPLGIETKQPRLSWSLISDRRNTEQTDYQVLVSSDAKLLARNVGDMWDTGRVFSDRSVQVEYQGKAPKSEQRLFWKVRVWDHEGRVSAWSRSQSWTMGILSKSDWNADWIGATDKPARLAKDDPTDPGYAAILLRKTFDATKVVRRALVSVSGLGYYELWINGVKVGPQALDPGFTRYDKRVLYASHDATLLLKPGRNSMGVRLGGGWFHLATPDLFAFEKAPWTNSPRLLLRMKLEYADGTFGTVSSDDTWKWSTSEITFNCLRGGETQDLRLIKPGWTSPGYRDSGWLSVKKVAAPQGVLVAQKMPPIRENGIVGSIALTEPKPGIYVFKLHENIAGWPRLSIKGTPGQKVTLKCAETLTKEGVIDRKLASHTFGRFQEDEVILAGNRDEVFEPHFTYHGFQYIQVEGLTEKPHRSDVVGVRVSTVPDSVGEFTSSDTSLSELHRVILATYLNNLHSIPTDCPQREKMGWMADGAMAMEMALFNYDVATTYAKWTEDLRDAAAPSGSMPAFVPTAGWGEESKPGFNFSDPWWGGATVLVPWNLYVHYGDVRILKEHFPAMSRFVDYLEGQSRNGILVSNLGDWLEANAGSIPTRTPNVQTSTAALAFFATIVADTAEVIGSLRDVPRYREIAQRCSTAFHRTFFRPATGLYGDDTQTTPSMALVFNLADPLDRKRVLDGLVANIKDKWKGHLSGGILGANYIPEALRQAGRNDLVYTLLTVPGFPGYKNMLDKGATTLWESWDGSNSLNHPMLGSVGAWFYRGLAGIEPDVRKPGFKHFTIRPGVLPQLTYAKASLRTPYGIIASGWSRAGNGVTYTITVPVNTRATVIIAARDPSRVLESGAVVSLPGHARSVRFANGLMTIELGSGSYSILVK